VGAARTAPWARRAVPALFALGSALVALAAWLLVPRPAQDAAPRRPPLHAILVDGSASATRTRPDWSAWARRVLRAECRAATAADAELLVIGYGMDVVRAFGPGAPDEFHALLAGRDGRPFRPGLEPGRDLGTELARALALAERELFAPGRAPGAVRILTDGEATGPDPGPALARLIRAGVELTWLAPPPSAYGDLAVHSLRTPPRTEEGAPLAAVLELAFRPRAAASGPELALAIACRLTGPGAALETVLPVSPPRGAVADEAGWIRWTERVTFAPQAPGLYSLGVRARLSEAESGRPADPVHENDGASASLRVGDPLVAVVVARDLARFAPWLAADAFAGVQFVSAEPHELAGALADADILITFDVGPADLPRDPVLRFVMEGGGWLSFAGWGFLRGWLPESDLPAGSLQAALPLAPNEEDAEPRDVVLIVDGSGSMTGGPFEHVRTASLDLVLGALPRDHIELRFFTGALGPKIFESASGQSVEQRQLALAPLLAARVPGGPTDILYMLGQLATLREAATRPGLVLLLTDGQTGGWVPERSRALRRRLAVAGTKLTILAVGEQPDREFLASLLLAGEALVEAGDLSDLARLLNREVNLDRIREGDGLLAIPADPSTLAEGLGRDVLAAELAESGADPWPLARSVRGRARDSAEVLWVSSEGDPLLALQRVGRGVVAACATTPDARWAAPLANGPGRLAPLVRTLGRARTPGAGAWIEARGDELVLEGAEREWPPVLEARIARVRAARPGGRGEDLERLGDVRFVIGTGGSGLDPRELRRAPRPDFLDAVPAGELLRVELRTGEAAPPVLAFPAPGPVELSGAAMLVDRAPLAWDAAGRDLRRSPRAQNPLAMPILGLGLALLTLAGVLLGRAGQGIT